MTLILVRLATLAAVVAFCATLAYWAITLQSHDTALPPTAPPPPALQASAAADLFGGRPTGPAQTDVHVVGILNLGPNQAAAIVSTDSGSPHVFSVGSTLEGGTRIAEVRSNSIVLDHNGHKSEVFVPKSEEASGYLR